jgi:hypothetical protein|tara:strand:+ start:1051 stop:1368 length:318 start_codon:yes stop_codon:yes gene_type:complete
MSNDAFRSIKVKRTTQQWNAFPHFKHCVEFSRQFNFENFWEYSEAVAWCWESFDRSIDLDVWLQLKRSNKKTNTVWCFQTQTSMHPARIYLKTSKELEMFLLKWG